MKQVFLLGIAVVVVVRTMWKKGHGARKSTSEIESIPGGNEGVQVPRGFQLRDMHAD